MLPRGLIGGPLLSRTTVVALVAANLVPLIGVLVWNWSVFEIVFVYWAENLIIGLMVLLKIIFSQGEVTARGGAKNMKSPAAEQSGRAAVIAGGTKLFLVPFFIVHYGIFCAGHGTFLFTFFGRDDSSLAIDSVADVLTTPLQIALGALFISHLFSFFRNYIGAGEYQRLSPPQLMMSPYKRIVILHVAIILGAALTEFLGSPVGVLVILVAAKIVLDIRGHNLERRESQSTDERAIRNLG